MTMDVVIACRVVVGPVLIVVSLTLPAAVDFSVCYSDSLTYHSICLSVSTTAAIQR